MGSTGTSFQNVLGLALIGAAAASAALLLVWRALARRRDHFDLRGRVVFITGGSSGIGLACAASCLAAGAHVALMARKPALLEAARRELQAGLDAASSSSSSSSSSSLPAPARRITVHAGDVADSEATRRCADEAAAAHGGRLDAVVASAGISCPRLFEETPAAEFASVLAVNVGGVRNAILHALPHMPRAEGAARGGTRGGGRVVIVSSQAGQAGLFGFTAYSASKFALAGLAQALNMELHTRGVRVALCYPPDTDTPLLALENETKPAVTKALSESTSTVSAQVVGDAIRAGLQQFEPHISFGFDGWMLTTLCAGFGAPAGWAQVALEALSMGLWRLVALGVAAGWYATVRRMHAAAAGPGTSAAAAALLSGGAGGGGGGSGGSAGEEKAKAS
jgi:3-dehydrosphinganine reductase